MAEHPIETIGIIREVRSSRVYRVMLINGKSIVGHLPGRLAELSASLLPGCLLYTSPSPRDRTRARMPSAA